MTGPARPGAAGTATRAGTRAGPTAVLIGPPGAGKTTIGRALADLLGVSFRDTDADIEQQAGARVADIFVEHGEPRFRDLERVAVARALAEHDGVLALGGGAPMDPRTQRLLTGLPVVFLEVQLAPAARRLGLDAPRPLLLDAPRATWTRLMAARRDVYSAVARVTVDTSDLSPDEAAAEIRDGLGAAGLIVR